LGITRAIPTLLDGFTPLFIYRDWRVVADK
jgi:hypothetical protein